MSLKDGGVLLKLSRGVKFFISGNFRKNVGTQIETILHIVGLLRFQVARACVHRGEDRRRNTAFAVSAFYNANTQLWLV